MPKNATLRYLLQAYLLAQGTTGLRFLFDYAGVTASISTTCVMLVLCGLLLFVGRTLPKDDDRMLTMTNLATCTSVALIAVGRLTQYPLVGTAGVLLAFWFGTAALLSDNETIPLWRMILINSLQAVFVAHWLFAS